MPKKRAAPPAPAPNPAPSVAPSAAPTATPSAAPAPAPVAPVAAAPATQSSTKSSTKPSTQSASAPAAQSATGVKSLERMSATDYLRAVLSARVYDLAVETDLTLARNLSERLGNKILIKREDQQPVFSFKLRGAYNKMAHLTPDLLAKGVICASAGNHAQGVALSARRLNARAVIVMPLTTPEVKVENVKALGGEVVLCGESYSDAYQRAAQLQAQEGLTFIHPFDDPLVIAGQGTIALEILRQFQGPIDAVFVPIGGGGLIAGVAAFLKAVHPQIKIVGVHMTDSDAMAQSVERGERVTLSEVGLFADGTAVKLVGEETFRACQAWVDEFVRVDTDAVCAAIKDIFVDTRAIAEPSGALSVAAIKQYVASRKTRGETYVAILSGANMNFDRLRLVAERAEVGEEREALLAITIPEERGSFRRLCEFINLLPDGPRAVTEFSYRISDRAHAQVFIGLTSHGKGDSEKITELLSSSGYATIDLTADELSKEHVRYMVGGQSSLASNERLLQFVFPERPGALFKFLNLMAPSWNISLFHYRNQGGEQGHILVGIQVPAEDDAAFKRFLDDLGYPWDEQTHSAAYRMFLRGH